MNGLAILSQTAFAIWFVLGHWISLPPLNNLKKEAFPQERRINLILLIFQLASIIGFVFHISWLMWIGLAFWSVSFLGHIISWWLPYFFGFPETFLKNAEEDNQKTYHFLPPRKNHPIPDLNHCIIGMLLLIVLITSWISVSL